MYFRHFFSHKKNTLQLETEPEFQEFMEAHKARSQKAVWANDTMGLPGTKPSSQKSKVTGSKVDAKQESEDDDDDDDDSDDEENVKEESEESEGEKNNAMIRINMWQ